MGNETAVGQSSSSEQYKAPPAVSQANLDEMLAKRERLRKSNFAVGQTKVTEPLISSSHFQNSALEQRWQAGNFAEREQSSRPLVSNIKFGSGCQYESESKSNFTGQKSQTYLGMAGSDLKQKFIQGNLILVGGRQDD